MRTGDFLVQKVSSAGAQIPLLSTAVRRAALVVALLGLAAARGLSVATLRLSPVAASGGFSSLRCTGFSLCCLSRCRAWASVVGLSFPMACGFLVLIRTKD